MVYWIYRIVGIIVYLVFSTNITMAGIINTSGNGDPDSTSELKPKIFISYGNKGWEFKTADNNYALQIDSRIQFRYATPMDTDPITYDDFDPDKKTVLKINRARLKIGGNAYRPWMKYYWEYELAAGNLLDFRVMIEKWPWLKIKAGQWKAQYNRERVISSGKQQLADRSLINRPFTIDRQQGVSLFGHIADQGMLNFNYWVSVFTGNGRGATTNDDHNLMYMMRMQWNFLGDVLKFEGSDTKYHQDGTGLIALAAVTNRSPYTRFSQAGGGQLEGFEDGQPGQYRVNQAVLETALMYRGFSWQQELHWKEIDDRVNNQITVLLGNYVQMGYFFYYLWSWFPKPMEIAARHAIYSPDRDLERNLKQEVSLVLNWFFRDHRNKLTVELSHFKFQENIEELQDGWRFRMQWDISL